MSLITNLLFGENFVNWYLVLAIFMVIFFILWMILIFPIIFALPYANKLTTFIFILTIGSVALYFTRNIVINVIKNPLYLSTAFIIILFILVIIGTKKKKKRI